MAGLSPTSSAGCSQINVPQQPDINSAANSGKACQADQWYSSSYTNAASSPHKEDNKAPPTGTPTAKAFIRARETEIEAAALMLKSGLPAPMRQQVEKRLEEAKQELAKVKQQPDQKMDAVTPRDQAEELKKQTLTLKTYDNSVDTKSFNNVGFTTKRTAKNTERLNTPDGSEIWVSPEDRAYINAAIDIEGKAVDLYPEGENGLNTEQAQQWTKNRDQAAQAEVSVRAREIASGRRGFATVMFGPDPLQPGPTTNK